MLIRRMNPGDLEDVTRLSGQLGYEADQDEIAERFLKCNTDFKQTLFVAETPDQDIVGWIQAREDHSLLHDPRVLILALVVDSDQRGKGIGTLLMNQIEKWAHERRLATIHFTSRTTRTDAHRLYERLGYQNAKTSYWFVKKLK